MEVAYMVTLAACMEVVGSSHKAFMEAAIFVGSFSMKAASTKAPIDISGSLRERCFHVLRWEHCCFH